jgi:hypothetical protein
LRAHRLSERIFDSRAHTSVHRAIIRREG